MAPRKRQAIAWTNDDQVHDSLSSAFFQEKFCFYIKMLNTEQSQRITSDLWPLLLTWFNFNPCMDK